MKLRLSTLGLALGIFGFQGLAFAQSDTLKAAERCESAVAETIKRMRGRSAQELQFIGAKRNLLLTQDDETGVRGEGRYNSKAGGTIAFTYSCAYDAKAGTTSGVMFRETGSDRLQAESSWQPDLTFVSPDACETATAADLGVVVARSARGGVGAGCSRAAGTDVFVFRTFSFLRMSSRLRSVLTAKCRVATPAAMAAAVEEE